MAAKLRPRVMLPHASDGRRPSARLKPAAVSFSGVLDGALMAICRGSLQQVVDRLTVRSLDARSAAWKAVPRVHRKRDAPPQALTITIAAYNKRTSAVS